LTGLSRAAGSGLGGVGILLAGMMAANRSGLQLSTVLQSD